MKYDFRNYISVKSSNGFQISALCPFHDDRRPSFSANEKSGLWICHAGCGSGNFDQFKDFFKNSYMKANYSTFDKPKPRRFYKGQKVAEYNYYNEDAQLSQVVERFESRDGSKYFKQKHMLKTGVWNYSAYPGQLVPYNYFDWKDKNEPIFLVEGEKCADALTKIGCNSATIPGGASAWNSLYSRFFLSKDVVILPDNDVAGRDYADQVFESLLYICKSIKIYQISDLLESEDVYDWILKDQKSHTKEKLFSLVFNQ